MALRTETLTVLPALFLFVLSSCFAFYTSQVVDPSARQGVTILALSLFVGGLVLTFHWGYYWVISRRLQESKSRGLSRVPSFEHLISFSLLALGTVTLVWVGQLTLYDMVTWGKDITRVFFSSRIAEHMFPTLGIGMRVIHYFLIGLALILLGLVVLFRIRKCPHHFGYYASQPKKNFMPNKCLICPKAAECVSGKTQEPKPSTKHQKPKPSTKPTAKNENARAKDSPKCLHNFGYLRSLPDSEAVPNECKACQELLECRNII